jgi:hypothetical protein
VDWESRTAACPAKVTQSTQYTVTVTGINDVAMDFKTGQRVEYQFRAKGTPVSVTPPENLFAGQTGPEKAECSVTKAQLQANLDKIRSDAAANPSLTPAPGVGVPLSASLAAANNSVDVGAVKSVLADNNCSDLVAGFANDPVVQWVKRLGGNHSVDFHVNLEPNQTYTYTIQESWLGKNTNQGKMSWTCGETDIVSMSIGPLVTTLPSRTYDHQKAPVPAGSSTTQDILVVGNNSNINLLGAALLNYHFPQIPSWPAWTGFALSVGPVYQLGNNSPGVSSLGVFFGLSAHLYRSVYLTPGVHVGQFADFPAGFYPGAVIPSGFGDLTPVKRNTARFAIGLTFKTTSFKKSSQNSGAATTTNSAGNQPASGNTKQQPPLPPAKKQ